MADLLIVLQARTGSRRLPAKSLAHVRGYPMAILAALRAGNRGDRVILATSDEPGDDMLAEAAAAHGVTCLRGPLDDVLARYVLAIGAVDDDTAVVRLTGDNIVPDGDLIHEVVDAMRAAGEGYMSLGAGSGLPYGVSVEVTLARHLRSAQANATTAYEREHVTPWIREHIGSPVFDRYAGLGLDAFRTTVDSLDDLMSILRVFPRTDDPVLVPWREIVDRVGLGLYQPGAHLALPDLVMGTVQLGMPYGINRAGTPSRAEAHHLVRTAVANGVTWLDTARVYGDSETVIGEVLGAGWDARCRVVTKLDALTDWAPTDSAKGVRAAARASLLRSQLELRLPRLDTVLLHRAAHWTGWGGVVAELLKEWQAEGRIGTIGISVQSPDELRAAIDDPAIGQVQMPFNILDHRWEAVLPALVQARRTRKLTVHLRSALLQGLLLSDDPALWARAHVDDPAPVRAWLEARARDFAEGDIAGLCLTWCRVQPWADGVVVGMDNLAQLERNLEVFSTPAPDPETLQGAIETRPILAGRSLDPAQWKKEG